MIRAYSSWKSKIQYLKILEYFLRSIKKWICKTEKFKFLKVCSFMHSILGRGSFSTNSSISEEWHGSDQPVALLRHYWAFSSSVLLDTLFLIFVLKISHRFHMGFKSGMLDGQSSTVISWSANHLEVVLALWAGAKVLLEKEISISIKLVIRWKHKVLQNLLVDGCIDFGFDKTQWTNTSRCHDTPNHHWLGKLHNGLQSASILCLSSHPPDFRPWFPNEMQNLLLSEKRTLDHWATVQLFFSLAQVRCFWRCFCFRSGLVSLFLKTSESGDSWCTDSSFSPLLVKLSQVFESALLDNILKLAVIPVACVLFLYNFFLPVNFAFNMLWYSTLWTATPFSNDLLWFILFVEGVSDCLLDHCQVSSLPHYCGFKEQEIPGIYTVGMVL